MTELTTGRARMLFSELLSAAYADQIRRMRRRAGMTQQQVADAIGSHRPIYARIEEGRHLVTLGTLERLASAFGVRLARMVPGGEPVAIPSRGDSLRLSNRRRGGQPMARAMESMRRA